MPNFGLLASGQSIVIEIEQKFMEIFIFPDNGWYVVGTKGFRVFEVLGCCLKLGDGKRRSFNWKSVCHQNTRKGTVIRDFGTLTKEILKMVIPIFKTLLGRTTFFLTDDPEFLPESYFIVYQAR